MQEKLSRLFVSSNKVFDNCHYLITAFFLKISSYITDYVAHRIFNSLIVNGGNILYLLLFLRKIVKVPSVGATEEITSACDTPCCRLRRRATATTTTTTTTTFA